MKFNMNNDQQVLMNDAVAKLHYHLSDDKNTDVVSMMAFDCVAPDGKEVFQVQVYMTRNESAFIDPFTVEFTNIA